MACSSLGDVSFDEVKMTKAECSRVTSRGDLRGQWTIHYFVRTSLRIGGMDILRFQTIYDKPKSSLAINRICIY